MRITERKLKIQQVKILRDVLMISTRAHRGDDEIFQKAIKFPHLKLQQREKFFNVKSQVVQQQQQHSTTLSTFSLFSDTHNKIVSIEV